MTPLGRLALLAACAAAAGKTTRATKETKPADQPLADNYGVNQTRAVNETKQAATDQTFFTGQTPGFRRGLQAESAPHRRHRLPKDA